MIEHRLKTWPKQYQDVLAGVKTFEVRKNDRDFQVGDFLLLKEYDPETKKYTGPSLTKKIVYIFPLKGPICDGCSDRWHEYVVMGIK